ncbi:MAG TPA: NADH-quinone oxidoreductase subunit H, partial [Candidatus Paceibacterota bacterium]|nr:NADH-quinone oxidoreductase subunit H [Candidatus Paceibacterota bacterium]
MTELLLAISGAGMLLSILAGIRAPKCWLVAVLAGSVAALGAAAVTLNTGNVWDFKNTATFGGEIIHLHLDSLGAVFLALLSVVGGAGAVYSQEYWSRKAHPRSAAAGRIWWSVLMLCIALVLIAANGLHFLFAWEIFTLAAYLLVTLDRSSRDVRAAGWLYLGASHVAALSLFAFFAILAANTGSWELGPMHDRP